MNISIVTPSLNQGEFIERTILSVLSQTGAFDLEYIVVDGGSTDDSLEIIKKHEDKLRWVSEEDRGQSDAINKGFNMASGGILAWLNSDDTYEPDALSEVAEQYRKHRFKWCFGNCRNIDENDREIYFGQEEMEQRQGNNDDEERSAGEGKKGGGDAGHVLPFRAQATNLLNA